MHKSLDPVELACNHHMSLRRGCGLAMKNHIASPETVGTAFISTPATLGSSTTRSRIIQSRRIPSHRHSRMELLSDEEKRHILQPSPYQPHRRVAMRAFEPPPSPPVTQPEQFPDHGQLVEAIKAIRGDPLEAHGGRIVTHRGNPLANLMIVGEAPGEQEDLQGLPFVGRAGQLLDKIFEYGGFDIERQAYVTNVVKRRPPDNRNPTRAEIEFFMPYLTEEIRLVDPKILILAGSISARALLGPHLRITKDRGRWYDIDGRCVMPVLHPSYLLRVQVAKYDMVKDIEAIREKYIELMPEDPLKELQKGARASGE